MEETRTEGALPPLVEAVRSDFQEAAETVERVAAFLERMEPQLRIDREAATRCHGTADALRTYSANLRAEAEEFARRVLPASREARPVTTLQLAAGGR